MIGIVIGIAMGVVFTILYNYSKRKKLDVKWWGWTLTILWLGYTGFVIKMAESFIVEGAFRAALVMAAIFGFVSIIGGVLLSRFIFSKAKNND